MSTAKIEIGYDGAAVRGGSMDIRELAPALLALGELLQETHYVLNDGHGRLSTNVKSDFRTGSFEVNLELVQDLADKAAFLFKNYRHWGAQEIAVLLGLSAGASASLLKFIKWLKNRKIKSSTVIETGNIKIETEGDYDSIEVTPEVVRLAKNRRVRLHLSALLKPLKGIGIDLFYAKEGGKEIDRVVKDEVKAFDAPEMPEHELVNATRRIAVNLIGIFFEEGLKWRLSDGENKINAAVHDESFQKEINAGKSFAKGDILVIELRTRQISTGDGIKNEHEIVKVIQHIPAFEQAELPLEIIQPSKPTTSSNDQT